MTSMTIYVPVVCTGTTRFPLNSWREVWPATTGAESDTLVTFIEVPAT